MRIENLTFKLDDNGKKHSRHKKLTLLTKMETSINVQTNIFTALENKGFADPRNKKTDIQFFNIDRER
jgi:hypothetical protein